MDHKPFFTTVEIWMISFVALMIGVWICANIQYRLRAREEKTTRKFHRDRYNRLRSTEPMDSSMSNRDNLTFKN